jgi:hypothetical protein
MLPTTYLATAVTLVTMAAAIPLNINLGAYSPALVVGDGAIEFRGEERPRNEAAAVVNALQAPSTGAAVQEAAVAAPVAKAATLPLSEVSFYLLLNPPSDRLQLRSLKVT